jgi:uncharacterized protein (TIGR02597 family)
LNNLSVHNQKDIHTPEMNNFLPILLAIASIFTTGAFAQNATTTPVGAMTVSIAAALSPTAPKISAITIPLFNSVDTSFVGQSQGVITSFTDTTISNSSAGWGNGTLSQAASPYFIRITSGGAAGRIFVISKSVANTSTTITIDNEGTPLTTAGLAVGDKYCLHPADTLLSFFGNGTLTGNGTVLSGTSANTADVVRLIELGGTSDYYFNSANNQWKKGSVPVNVGTTIIRPDRGIQYTRRATTGLNIINLGTVPDTNSRVVFSNAGTTFMCTTFPVDQTLAQLSLQTTPGWIAKSASVPIASADKVLTFDGTTWQPYHFDSQASQWRKGSVPVNVGTTTKILAGQPFQIYRPTGTSGVTVRANTIPYNSSN